MGDWTGCGGEIAAEMVRIQGHALANYPSSRDLHCIRERLERLDERVGTAEAGAEFERILWHWLDVYDLNVRTSYTTPGEQTDGRFVLGPLTYLFEAKWTKGKSNGKDVADLATRVGKKSRLTVGLFVSRAGYTKEAKGRLPVPHLVVLVTKEHLLHSLPAPGQYWPPEHLPDLVRRLQQHVNDEGEPLGPVALDAVELEPGPPATPRNRKSRRKR